MSEESRHDIRRRLAARERVADLIATRRKMESLRKAEGDLQQLQRQQYKEMVDMLSEDELRKLVLKNQSIIVEYYEKTYGKDIPRTSPNIRWRDIK